MASNTSLLYKTFYSNYPVLNNAAVTYSCTNHQGWQIQCEIDPDTLTLIFILQDGFGCKQRTSLFVVENLEPSIPDILEQYRSEHAKQQFLNAYLQQRLAEANSYQIHVEKHGDQFYVRLGSYGLKGGGRNKALIASLAQIGVGLLFLAKGVKAPMGMVLVSSGTSGGLYAYKNEEATYKDVDYLKQSSYGALSGIISGGIGQIASTAGTIGRLCLQAFGAAAGSAASTTVDNLVEKHELPEAKKVIAQAFLSGAGAAAGSAMTQVAGSVFGRVVSETGDEMLDFGRKIVSEGAKGVTSSSVSIMIKNLAEGKAINKELLEAMIVGGLVSGSVGAANHYNNIRNPDSDYQKNLKKLEDFGKDLERKENWLDKNNFSRDEIEKIQSGGMSNIEKYVATNSDPIRLVGVKLNGHSLADWKKAFVYARDLANFETNLYRMLDSTMQSYVQSSQKLSSQQIQRLGAVSSTNSVGFFDCDFAELISHVVLVHGFNADAIDNPLLDNPRANGLDDVDVVRFFADPTYRLIISFKKVVSWQGIVGPHYNLDRQQFGEVFAKRPHLHWAWNQLVQPGVGNPVGWDACPFALLEPLSTFEDTSDHKLFGLAPYDSFAIGSHRLSKRSIILVPNSCVEEVTNYLSEGYPGRVIGYEGYEERKPIRQVIIDTLKQHYPETWHISDEKGNEIGQVSEYFVNGYRNTTCLKKSDREIIKVIMQQGLTPNDQCQALKEANRFIGLHVNSITYYLENDSQQHIVSIKNFKRDKKTVKGNNFFAGSVSDDYRKLKGLSSVYIFSELYEKLLNEPKHKGTNEITLANYLINEAMCADLVSIFYEQHPDADFGLSVQDLKIVFEVQQSILIKLLEKMCYSLKSQDAAARDESISAFKSYYSALQELPSKMQQAKAMALLWKTKNSEFIEIVQHSELPACMGWSPELWKRVPLPDAKNIDFDLAQNLPHSRELADYLEGVLSQLPTNHDDMIEIYKQLNTRLYSRGLLVSNSIPANNLDFIPALEEKIGKITDKDIAQYLWLDPGAPISSTMVQKVNEVAGYLKRLGFELRGVKADGNCYCGAFLKSYGTLTQKIPVLDAEEDQISYLRGIIANQYGAIHGSENGGVARAQQIETDGEWLTALGEGDLLARALQIPIRTIIVDQNEDQCGIIELMTFPDKDRSEQVWSTIDDSDKPKQHITIVDLGGHFICAQPISEGKVSSLSKSTITEEKGTLFVSQSLLTVEQQKEKYQIQIIQNLIYWTYVKQFYISI